MTPHVKAYCAHFRIGEQDQPVCEVPWCSRFSVDVHHIRPRGMGGTQEKDDIRNLIGLCREHHAEAERNCQFNEELRIIAEDLENRDVWAI